MEEVLKTTDEMSLDPTARSPESLGEDICNTDNNAIWHFIIRVHNRSMKFCRITLEKSSRNPTYIPDDRNTLSILISYPSHFLLSLQRVILHRLMHLLTFGTTQIQRQQLRQIVVSISTL